MKIRKDEICRRLNIERRVASAITIINGKSKTERNLMEGRGVKTC